MDYQQGAAYEEYLDYYPGYPESQNRYAETVTSDGGGWQSAPDRNTTKAIGHNMIVAYI